MRITVFDAETDGLLDEVTKMHCLSATIYEEDGTIIQEVNLVGPQQIMDFMWEQDCIVGHNIFRFDIPVLKKLFSWNPNPKTIKIDTLPLSWYLYPFRDKHGLEGWGNDLGIKKPEISDWTNLSILDYIHRCSSDVKINARLFFLFISYLKAIYEVESVSELSIIPYLMFKMECAVEQEANPLYINREHCKTMLTEVEGLMEVKMKSLFEEMPKITKYKEKTKPKVMYKKDGSLSVAGSNWLELLFDNNLPPDYEESVKIVSSIIDPKPNSPAQLKEWLFSLGWQPTIFDYKVDKKTKIVRAIPQLQDKDKNLCGNILVLAETHPILDNLAGLFMLQHRQGVFKGFLEKSDENGMMKAEVNGFTNTLRFKHIKPIANLPAVGKPYGKAIRGAIMAPNEDYLFCGSDMSSLEDSTKQHYMYYYDPEYVTQMRVPGFDPHIDVCVLAGLLTKEQEDFFKWYNKTLKDNPDHEFTEEENAEYKSINKERKVGKVINFSGIYGAGPNKISLTSGMTTEKSTVMHKVYWSRNKAVKQIAKDTIHKVVWDQMWLFNPVSGFWYSLRAEKDKFSTLNQGTGVYCFDTWVREVRRRGIVVRLQYHDEIGFPFLKKDIVQTKQKLTEAIAVTNQILKLNVPLGISIDIGKTYADTH